MPEITVNRNELDRPIWREVGAYAKHKNPDGSYTISYKADVDPSKLALRKPRKANKVTDDTDPDTDDAS